MAGNRLIIGSETNDTRHLELDQNTQNNKITLPVTIYDAKGNQVSLASGLVPNTYDTLNLTYDTNGNLTKVVYQSSGLTVATLTLTYDSSSNLTKVVKT